MIRDISDVCIIDANLHDMDHSEFCNQIKEIKPDIVGVTVLMDQYAESGHTAARLAKKVNSGITTVLGGVYAATNANTAILDKNVDYIFIGEAEYTFRKFIMYKMKKGALQEQGICYKDSSNIVNLDLGGLAS